jgi:hypothetical protein
MRLIRVPNHLLLLSLLIVLRSPVAAAEYGVFGVSEFSKDRKEVVLVPWNSALGKSRFATARYKEDFFQLAQTYQPQINPLYCGIASSVIVLNALRLQRGIPSQAELEVQAPQAFGGNRFPFQSYSQLTFLNAETERVKPRQIIEFKNITKDNEQDKSAFDPGLTLGQLKDILKVYKVEVQLEYAADDNIERGSRSFRRTLKAMLSEPSRFLIVNFKGTTLGAHTTGHITPVSAYDSHSDSALLLDVASHKNPWYWVPVTYLYQAMHTKDGDHYRGYLVVSDGD